MKRTTSLALVTSVAMLTLAACGGGASNDEDTGDEGTQREFGDQGAGSKDA